MILEIFSNLKDSVIPWFYDSVSDCWHFFKYMPASRRLLFYRQGMELNLRAQPKETAFHMQTWSTALNVDIWIQFIVWADGIFSLTVFFVSDALNPREIWEEEATESS